MAMQSLVLLALVVGAIAGPVSYSTDTCASSCEENLHGYEVGKSYDYDLTATVRTSLPGAEDESTLDLTALAHLEVISSCDLALRLENIVLKEGGSNVDRVYDFQRGLQQNTLRFALAGGEVTDVCPEPSEPVWALNIKRAVLSSLQNTMDDMQTEKTTTETDIVGECPVTYEPTGSTWSGYTIRKTKDLLACHQPTQANTVFQSLSYNVPSKVQSLPLLKSTHECEQEFTKTDGRLVRSLCTENHIFRPFSRENSGATTVVTHSLVFKSESSNVRTLPQSVSRRTDLQFEHTPDQETQESSQRDVMNTLQQICEVTRQGIRPEVPGLFGDLVKGMRHLDLDTLADVGRRANRLCDKAESFFRDAVPTLGTAASIGLMRDMIKGGQATENEADMWLTALAFIPKPDAQMLIEVRPLLEVQSIRRKSYLAVSTMVSSYCRQNSECDRERVVRDIISAFQSNLGHDCSGDREAVLLSLKALGNTGHASQVISILNNCISNEGAPVEVRVAAINAMRRMDCNADSRTLMEVFRSTYTDSELRINAYLALMRCPTDAILSMVRNMLETEEINQVGSFVWTHLTNLMETASPLKQDISNILENERLSKAFDLDKRKFSRNVEWSAFSEAINTGVAVDSNLIWSSQSFVPRSAMVNLTVDLFGESVNLVELGGRIQGLDAILENMFADKQEGAAMTNNRINNFDSSFRRTETDPQGSYYIRVFGNEIRYEDFVGFDTQTIKDKLNYLQWLIELAKEHDIDFTKSILFLESEVKVPTVAGLPLVLSVDGTATMDLKITGKMDLTSLASSPSGLDITGIVRPTAAIELNGKLGVDAFVAKTGLKMTNTFHTSTVADGSITLKDGKIFNLDINMPNERMEIFNVQSKFYMTQRGQDREQQMPSDGRFEMEKCIRGPVTRALGVELCADLSLPRLTNPEGPWFPLTGPVTASLAMSKRDTFSKYHMEARMVSEKIRPGVYNREVIFSFNTPGSRFDREFTANFVVDNSQNAVRMDLRTPWKKVDINGSLVNTDELKRLAGHLTIDDSSHYSAISEIQINPGKYATRYTPNFQISIPDQDPYKLGGSVTYRDGKKADVEISIENVFQKPATFKGMVRKVDKNGKTRLESDIEIRMMSFKGQLGGFIDSSYTKDEIKADSELTIKYRTNSGPQSVSFTNNFQMQTPRERKSLVMTGAVASTLYPELDSDYSLQTFTEEKEHGLSLSMGLTNDKPKRITVDFQSKLDFARRYQTGLLQGLLKVTCVDREWEMKLDHSHNPNELKTIWTGRKDNREATWEMSLMRESQRPLRLAAEAKLTYPGYQMNYIQTLVQEGATYNHDLSIQVDREDMITLTSTYTRGRKHKASADLTLRNQSPIHVEGYIKPQLLDFAAEFKTNVEQNSLATDIEWEHTGDFRSFENKATWNLFVNRDRVGLSSDIKLQDSNTLTTDIEGKWNINGRGMRKASLAGTYVISRTTPSIQTRVQWWPSKFVDATINLKLDENDLSSATRDLEGSMRVQSSFSGYEEITSSFKHERRPTTVMTSGEVAWAPNKKIDGVFNLRKINGWANANMDLSINTPFDEARRIRTETTYNLEGQTLTTSGQATWNNKQITFESTSTVDLSGKNLDVNLRATTPFNGYESMNLVAKHSSAGRTCRSELKVDVGSQQLVAIDLNMDHQSNGYFITNSGSLSVNIPVRGYRTNKLTWNHENNARDINSRFELELEDDKSIFDIEAKNRRIFAVKANLITPYMKNVRVNIEHQGNRREHKYENSASVQYGRDTYSIENEFSLLDKSFKLKSKVNTPHRNWEELILDLNNVLEGNTFTGNNRFTCGYGHTYGISGTFINRGMPEFTMEMQLDCPKSGPIKINAANSKQMNIWVSSINAEYSNNQNINIVTKLGVDDMKKFSIDITTPYEAVRETSFDLEHRGQPTKFDTTVKFSHNKLQGRIDGELNVDVSDMNDIKIKLTATTPFDGATNIRSIFSHKVSSAAVYQTDFSLELPGKKTTASNMVRITNSMVFNTKTSLEYTTGQRIELEMDVNVERNIVVSGVFRSPWTGEQSASLNHQGSLRNFQTNLTIKPKPSESIVSNAEFSLRGDNMKAVGKITTPYDVVRIFEITANHRGSLMSFNNDAMIKYNDKTMEGNSRFTLDGRGFRGEVSASTPFENFRRVTFVFNHDGDLQVFTSKYELTYDNEKITLVGDYNFNNQGITGRFSLETPFTQLRTAGVNFEHSGEMTNFRNNGRVNYNTYQYSGDSSFSLQDGNLRGAINLRLPEEFKLEVNHNGELTDFNNNAALHYNGQDFTARSNFKLAGNNLEISANAETPFRDYRNLGLTFTHAGGLKDFQCDLTMQLEQEKIIARQSFKLEDDDLTHSITVQTPFNGYRNMAYSLTHKGRRNRMSTELSLSKEEQSIDYSSNFKLTSGKVSGNVNLNTPFDSVRRASINFFHNGEASNYNNELVMSLNQKSVTAKSSYVLSGTNAEYTINIETPFDGFSTAGVALKHNGPITDFNNEVTLSLERSNIKGSSSFRLVEDNLSLNLKLETPFECTRVVAYELTHSGSARRFNNEMTATYNNYNIKNKNTFAMRRGRVDGTFNIETPFEGFTTMTINIEHRGQPTDFNCEYSANIEDKKITLRHSFLLQNTRYEQNIALETPFPGYNRMGLKLQHNGAATDFNNEMIANLESSEIKAISSFNLRGTNIDASATLETPFRGYSRMGATLKHNGPATNCNSEAVLSLESSQIKGKTSFKLQGTNLEVSSSLETPFRDYTNMGVNIRHNGPATNFNNEITGNLESSQSKATSSFRLQGSSFDASASLETPLRYARNIVVNFKQDTTDMKNFSNEGVVIYNGQRYTGNTEFALRSEFLKVSASVQIPEVYGIAFEHRGPWTGFNNNLVITIADEAHTATSSFNYDDRMEGNLNIDTPNFPMTLRFNHEGQLTNFKQDSSLEVAGNTYTHSGEFSIEGRKVNGAFDVKTPHRQARSLSVKLDHQGKWNNFENSLILERNGDRIEAGSQLTANNKRIKGDITIKTPKEYSISIIQKGSADDLTAIVKLILDDDKSQATVDFKNKANVLEGSLNIRTPYKGYKNMGAEFSYKNKKVMSVTGSLKTPFARYDNFAFEVTHNGDRREFTTAGKIETPFRIAKVTMFEVRHTGRLTNFDDSAYIDVDQKRISGSATFKFNNREGLQASANVETPFETFRTGSASLSHTGAPTDFNTVSKVEFNGQTIEGIATFKKDDDITATATLTTPFEKVERATINVNHQGSLNSFRTSSDMSLNGQEVRGTFNFNKRGTVIETSGTLNTPFRQLRDGSFRLNHRGNYNDFVTTGEVEFNRKKIESELVFKLAPEIMTTARLTTPWTAVRQFNFNLNHRGGLMDFTTISSGELNGQRMSGNLNFKKDGNTIESSSTINTPFEIFPEWAYTYTYNMQPNNIRSTATLTLPCSVYKHFRGEFEARGSLEDFSSTLKVNTPFESFPEGNLNIAHRGNLQDFVSTGSLRYSGRKIDGEVSMKNTPSLQQAVLKASTPYRQLRDLHIIIDNQRRGTDMIGRVEATYNGDKHIDSDYNINVDELTSAILNVRAPVNMEMRGKNEEQNKEFNVNVPDVVSLTSAFEKYEDRFSQNSRLQLGRDANQVISYNLDGSYTTRGRQNIYDGRFVLNSPYGQFESNMNHKMTQNRYNTEINIQRINLKSDIELPSETDFKSTFTVGHPSFQRDVVFGAEGSKQDSYHGKINLEYADQQFTFEGKLADESQYSDTKYVAEAHLEHPASYLDVQFSTQLTNNREKVGGEMEVKYKMTRDRQLKSNALRAEINKLREELNMELDTPVKRVKMSGRRVEGNGQHFTVAGNVDDREMSADLQLNTEEPGFDINLQFDRENQVFVSGKYAEPSSLQLEAYREEYGRRIRESEVSITLNSENLVRARAFLNPDIFDDMKRLFGFDLGLEQSFNEAWRAIEQEIRYKRASLSRAFQPIKETFSEFTEPIVNVIQRMYNDNDFHLRTVVDALVKGYNDISDYFTMLHNKYGEHFARKWEEIKMIYADTCRDMNLFMKNVVTPYAVSAYSKTVDAVEYIRTHPTVTKFMDWLEAQNIEEHYATFRDYCINLVRQYNAMLDKVNAYWEEFKDIPGMTFVIDYIHKVVDGLRWVYDASELDELVQAWMRELRTHGWKALRMWWQSKNDMVEARYTQWEPEQGNYEVELKMPVSWSQVTSMPGFSISQYWEQLKNAVSNILPDFNFSFGNNWSFWDAFYTYKPSRNPLDWIPPFDTHATVAGSQHFMTFDKKFYQFMGECSYLLARDFINGKFSVIINYDNVDGVMTKKSITVHSGEKEIEILPDFKVLVDGKRSDMPVSYDKTVIRRIGNTIKIDNEHGLNITCDLPHDRCTVQVSGWYFGKTGGLLGTYDNEPATDMLTADRRHSSNIEDFAQSWSLGRRCRAVNTATQVTPVRGSLEHTMCAKYFEEEMSPFRLCYAQIKPEDFMTMCANEVAKSSDKEAAVCKIASFYVEQCKMQKVPIRMPKDCVKCTGSDGTTMSEGQTVTIEGEQVPKAADVVFVVSHKSCNREVIGRIDDIVKQTTRNFKQAGIRDVQFGLVGYGLPGVLGLPHSQTFEGELFNTGDKLSAAMSTFEVTNENTQEDSLAAIRFAARYPFRHGASKSIILIPCDSCQEQAVSYPDIQRMLLDRDIRMHVLLQHTFQLRTSARKTAYIFGVDRDGLFTPRSVGDEELNGDQVLRQQVYMPKDLCAALSQESDGSIFSISQLLEARTVVQKKFLDVLTRLTAKKGKPTECQICECVADETGVGMSVCRSCTPAMPMNNDWFEYGDSIEVEEEESSEETQQLTREEKRRLKQQRKLRMLRRQKARKNRQE